MAKAGLPHRSLCEGGSDVTRHFYHRSHVINGILKCVQRRIDLGCVEIDNVQYVRRQSKFSAAREFDQYWNFAGEMIGDTDDFYFFVDQLHIWKDRYRFGS